MKNIAMFVLVAIAGLSLTRGAKQARAQDDAPPPAAPNLDASRPDPVQPDLAQPLPTPPVVAPSTPTVPSPLPPTPPNPFKPVPFEPTPAPQAPLLPTPLLPTPPAANAPKLTDAQLSSRVRTAITQGSVVASGKPAAMPAGIAVSDLIIKPAGGKVTLRGNVHSEKEKSEAGARAAAVVGVGNVVNELTVR